VNIVRTTVITAALSMVTSLGLQAASTEIRYNSGPLSGGPAGITFETPDTTPFCGAGDAPNLISAVGVGKRVIRGRVLVQYETDKGLVDVPSGPLKVEQAGDLQLTISYPPIAEWPTMADGMRKIHVGPQLELFDKGAKVATLGPGNDWSLYCIPTP
jgi:hypothetical protein